MEDPLPRLKPPPAVEMIMLSRWSGQSACSSSPDPSLWDTVRANDTTMITDSVKRAREICLGCPVMLRCLSHAVAFDKRDQIWGGLTDEERDDWSARHDLVAV